MFLPSAGHCPQCLLQVQIFIPMLAASLAGYFVGMFNRWHEMDGITAGADLFWNGGCGGCWPLHSFIDNLLDTIASPLSVLAGTLVAPPYCPFRKMNPYCWAMALLGGGVTAGTIQLGTGFAIIYTKATAGTGIW
jgi:hypothetical protein